MGTAQRRDALFDGMYDQLRQQVPAIIAETATDFFRDTFRTKSWEGNSWAELNQRYAAKKTKGRDQVLVSTGALRNSILTKEATPSRVVISAGGADIPYARVHNDGLRVKGVRSVGSYVNSNFMGRGKPLRIKAHTRNVDFTMPKRQFIGKSPLLNQAIKDRLAQEWNLRQRR